MEKEVQNIETAPSHYLLAKIGKKVLRPGGRELSEKLIESLNIQSGDKVIEFAPGQGLTTSIVLKKHPKSYTGVELDEDHINVLKRRVKQVNGTSITFIQGDAENTKLSTESGDKLFGEAMLSMHADQRKTRIVKEAHRILKKGGLYAIHELELNLSEKELNKHGVIQRDLAVVSHVNARPLTIDEWSELLTREGFEIIHIERRPLKVLEPSRVLADEGFLQTLKIGFNVLTMPKARKRVFEMRKTFKAHGKNLNAVAILARKK